MSNHPHGDAKAPSPPPAPPLPPERQGFVANALARVAQPFGYGPRPTSITGHRASEPRPSRLSVLRSSRWAPKPSLRSLSILPKVPEVPQGSNETQADVERSPIASRSTSHKTGIPIAALDISPDHTHAVLAGRNILKTIQVSDAACAEDVNLRTSIIAYAATHEASGNSSASIHKDQWAANDVKWSHGQCSTNIATATTNGHIVIYDINRPGLEVARLHEHSRQVHRLAFNPYQGQLMLSGSQDGTVRLWDLRDLSGDRNVMNCHSRRKFSGNSEGIRDLRWSPVDGMIFALGADNGVIQRWDIRNDKTPLLKVNAHEYQPCHAIDWHPDGKHLVSAGADKNIKVWDFSSSDRRKKHLWEIRAPQAIFNVRWRPPCWSSGKHNQTRWQCTQIATSYDQLEPKIHIWDFRRPHVPFRTLDRYETPASGLLWHSENLLWSVESAGMFTQTDINFLPKTMNRRSPNGLAIAADGRILFWLQKRERRRTSFEDVLDDFDQQNQYNGITDERARDSLSTGQGSSEEPGLLSSSFKTRQRNQSSSMRSKRSSTGTPPSGSSTGPVANLGESLRANKMHRPSQVAGIGYVKGLFDAPAFRFLARNYRIPEIPPNPTRDTECNLHVVLGEALLHNSTLAARTGQYRLAQSLKILALAIDRELKARAELNYQRRMQAAVSETFSKHASPRSTEAADHTKNQGSIESTLDNDLLRASDKASSIIENASNMTTPLARPIPDSAIAPSASSVVESLQLPDAKWNKQPVKPAAGFSELAKLTSPNSASKESSRSQNRQDDSRSASENDVSPEQKTHEAPKDERLSDVNRQMAERRAEMHNYRAVPRPLLRLDDPIHLNSPGLDVPRTDRHDSNESFQMFSASTDSSHGAQSAMSSFKSTQDSQQSTSSPEHTGAVQEPVDHNDQGQEASALVFDDEAQLRSSVRNLASPPKMIQALKEMEEDKIVESLESQSNYRPVTFQQPIIHREDIEEWDRQAEPLLEPTEEDASDESHKYILEDYIPPEQEPDDLLPWAASKMFEPVIDFHTYKLYDAQLPTWLLLHLGRWLHHSIPYERVVRIYLQYHRQLIDLGCVVQAAELRKSAGEEYPEVAEYGLYGITSGKAWCTTCQKRNEGNTPGRCERCNERWGDCPVCNGAGPISRPDAKGISRETDNRGANGMWIWCQDCGHGGHMACLSIFWETEKSEGACPTLGCLCDCVPGRRRDEIMAKLEKEREAKKPAGVKKDQWKVPESAAAQRARGLMGEGRGLNVGGGVLGLAAAGRSVSGGKKVRIVVPEDEEGVEDGGKGKGKGKGKEVESKSAPAP